MRTYSLLAIGLAFVLTVAACTDEPAPSAKGTRAVGGSASDEEAQEAKPAPETQAGVVPDLIGVTLKDSKKAVKDAGFKVGDVRTIALFGDVTDDQLVCVQGEDPGSSPPKGAEVTMRVDTACSETQLQASADSEE